MARHLRRWVQGPGHVVEQHQVPRSAGSGYYRGAVWPRGMSRRNQGTLSAWQKQLVDELRALAKATPHDLRIVQQPKLDAESHATVRVRLNTASILRSSTGLVLENYEEFILQIRPSMFVPPSVEVDHPRFLGFPHVLQGQRLCIYLDPSREWRPSEGMAGFLNRLWGWLTDAAGGKFDPSTAMYHAVGGVLHHADDTPTIVVREPGPTKPRQIAQLIAHSTHRYDLTYSTDAMDVARPSSPSRATCSSVRPRLSRCSLHSWMIRISTRPEAEPPRVAAQSPAFISPLLASALRNPDGEEQYFVLAVPHPAGGPHHLLGGRLHATTADALRRIAKKHGTAINLDPTSINAEIPIEWCNMSDERQAVTTRRDERRPVNGYQGKTVHIWGCGGLGSWAAEFIARAGAAVSPSATQGHHRRTPRATELHRSRHRANESRCPRPAARGDPRRPDCHRRDGIEAAVATSQSSRRISWSTPR